MASSASTDAPTTGLDPLTGSGTATQGTTSDPTSPGTTGETGTGAPGTTTTGGETTDSGSTTSETTTEGTTGGIGGGPCEVDADCKLHDDCCSCFAIPTEQDDVVCDARCDQTQCQQIGIDEAKCVLGQCITEKVHCGGEVFCDALPPDCPPGTLPGVDDFMGCWTGACVPVISCWWVTACELCPDSFICVNHPSVFGDNWTCLPRPVACEDEVDCECAGAACNDGIEVCEGGGGDVDLVCHCPDC
ncbi:hypothetical protein [Nannocystis bainbridge]|uniref:Uncharacterized protein n=1 Tax=Nannocystis bainbridge TaxID=2995303 RepID=A0ABT5DTB1_9BACT|nr:hypothetical protein [Nannocystis bainbridge]MDC0715652.1 hypothetical protein [Nannocystis bainbridge]